MTQPEIVKITQELAEQWYGNPPPFRMQGYAVKLGNEILGIAGSYIYGTVTKQTRFLFAEMKPEARRYKKVMVLVARKIMADYHGRELFAVAQENVQGAAKLLEYLGFQSVNGYLYTRRAS